MPRYEFSQGTSHKFWEIKLSGTSFTTTYGKVGTSGQTTTKQWDSEAEAKNEYEKLIAEKVKKGYKLVEPAPTPRYFELIEGAANKFWEIRIDGTSIRTRSGKIGTAGQQTLKEFDSAEQANQEYDKLVNEKTKKG